MKKKVLIFNEFYLPGVKGGGPIRSIENMVNHLSDQIDFYILTSDRDFGDKTPYKNTEVNKWNQVGKAKVMYVNKQNISITLLKKVMLNVDYDYIYLNSFFNYKFSVLPLFTKIRTQDGLKGELILAPRGEFSPGALSLKSFKKKTYINFFEKFVNLKKITWQATTYHEENDIRKVFDKKLDIKTAGNLTANYRNLEFNKQLIKESGKVNLIFISRIHPKKNLLTAIKMLSKLRGEVLFDIYGPIEDENYWNKCKDYITKLPANIQVNYKRILTHDEIINTFKKYHFFLFPTLGENFGHVISESLVGGCPVITSDQTPWKKLEELEIGWDIPLDNNNKFVEVIQHCIGLDHQAYYRMSRQAFNYGFNKSTESAIINNSLDLFKQ